MGSRCCACRATAAGDAYAPGAPVEALFADAFGPPSVELGIAGHEPVAFGYLQSEP